MRYPAFQFGRGSVRNKVASFDGTGNNYLKVTCPDEVKTYPFWVSCWVRPYRQLVYATVYCIWSAERTSSGGSGQGTCGIIYKNTPWAFVGGGTPNDKAISAEATLTDPYWDHLLSVYTSATSRAIYINGVSEGTNATDVTPDFSAGSPEFRIGRRALTGSAQYYKGDIADVLCGAGTLSAGDITTLSTMGATYSAVTSAAHWWKLSGDGLDAIGSADMTAVGTMAYVNGTPTAITAPTRAQAITEVFKGAGLPSASPTVTAGGTPPITVTTNLASVEHIDWSISGTFGAYNSRMWHYIPTTSLDHVVFVNGGHQFAADAATYGMDILVQQLVGAGYAVVQSFLPSFGATDPDHPGSSTLHNTYFDSYSASVNPLERYLSGNAIVMNNIAGRYTKRSVCGLSGGGWLAVHFGALDARINHAVISIRGGLADRRSLNNHDGEQWPKPNGWKAEEFFKLCAQTNRVVKFVVHQTDPSIAAMTGDTGAYISAASYTTNFLDPISAAYPLAQISFYEDQGAAPHAVTQDCIDNAVLPALAATLN